MKPKLTFFCNGVRKLSFIPSQLLTLTFTFVAGVTLAVASRTFALIGTNRVDAIASSTETWHCLALVHI